MSNLEQAVVLMNNRWLDSLGEMDEYVTSKQQIRKVKRIAGKLRGNKYHHLTRRALATLVAAAILLSTATIAIANESSRKFIIEKFKEYSIYKVDSPSNINVTPIKIDYIPDGFIQSEYNNLPNMHATEYISGNLHFSVEKWNQKTQLYFDTEEYENDIITIDGKTYTIFYTNDANPYGIIWNDAQYSYIVGGNLPKEELLRIAVSTK